MANEPRKHSIYINRLKAIGKTLGFNTKPRKAVNEYYRNQYHLANPDCIWYMDVDRKLREEGIFPDDAVPVIVFEVLYSESEKAMRGSLLSLPFRNPFRGILVLLRKDGESDQHYEDRKKYLDGLLSKTKYDNIDVWVESHVDELFERLVGGK